MVIFLVFVILLIFFIVVANYDPVHEVETKMAYFNFLQHLEIFSEIRLVPGKLQFAVPKLQGITHFSEKKIPKCC